MPEIVIDTDNIFHRIYSIIKKKEYFREDMAGRNKLINDVDNFCASVKKRIPHSAVSMTMDSQNPWRGKIFPPYKQNRTDNDRTFLRSCMDEFAITRAKDNCILKFQGYEGDDIIACVADINADKGISTVVISSDSDLNQLVKCREDGTFTVQYDPDASKKLFYIDHMFQAKESSIFDDNMIDDVYLYTQSAHKMINPVERLIVKLVSGDDGDNIPSCYPNINGKNRSFGEKSGEKMFMLHAELQSYTDTSARREVVAKILKMAHSKETSRIDEIMANIQRNINLIYLHKDFIHEYDNLKSMVAQKLKYRC